MYGITFIQRSGMLYIDTLVRLNMMCEVPVDMGKISGPELHYVNCIHGVDTEGNDLYVLMPSIWKQDAVRILKNVYEKGMFDATSFTVVVNPDFTEVSNVKAAVKEQLDSGTSMWE